LVYASLIDWRKLQFTLLFLQAPVSRGGIVKAGTPGFKGDKGEAGAPGKYNFMPLYFCILCYKMSQITVSHQYCK
jgi:hypothetical protein